MNRLRPWLFGTGIALAACIAAIMLLTRSESVQDAIARRVVERRLAGPATNVLDYEGMRVLLCGTASPLPDRHRAQACTAVIAGGKWYVVDTGSGSWKNLGLWRIPGERLAAVLLTHFHSDHIGDLGEFNLQTWVAGREGPLRVYGAAGVERVISGFSEAYALDTGYRIAHHGADLLPPAVGQMVPVTVEFDQGEGLRKKVVLREGDLTITAFLVDHAPVAPAIGYRFDHAGRSVVVSGDTVKFESTVEMSRGVDVLVHEAQANHLVNMARSVADAKGLDRIAKIMSDIPSYHTTPVEAAEIADEAGVRLLVMTHLTPPPTSAIANRVFLRGVARVRPDGVELGTDGLLVSLPARSDDIEVSHVDG